MKEQFTTRTELKHKVQFALRLECISKLYDEWVLDVFLSQSTRGSYQDGALCYGMFYLILFDQVLLFKSLDCIDLLCVSLLAEDHLAIRAGSNDLHEVKVVNTHAAIFDLLCQKLMLRLSL